MKNDIILCECSSSEHQAIIIYDSEDPLVYLSIHLNNYKSFFKRVIHAIKYVFGYKSRYGAWDEIILSKEHIDKLKDIIKHIEK